MTSNEYAEIAKAAKTFQLNQQLSPHRRRIAQSLYELANQLTNPEYGCPAETYAIMAMYHHLLNTTLRLHWRLKHPALFKAQRRPAEKRWLRRTAPSTPQPSRNKPKA